jgi:transcription-repair coupling factor (superfamily II helicase)
VPDTETRLSLYRRFTQAEDGEELNQLAAEMADRFGPPPPELAGSGVRFSRSS